jgi:acyl-coenzyme A synthetase/AMP-(fatty) acid ligase
LYHRDLGVGCDDRVSTPTSPAYTGTIWALLGSLTNGAAFLFSKFDSPRSFVESLNREQVTVVQLIVTLFRQLLFAIDEPLNTRSIRLVYTGGEALHKDDVRKFERIFPAECNLLYNFGSTEAGMITHFPVDREKLKPGTDAPIPVGVSVEDTAVTVLDANEESLLNQEEGEIAVSSHFLSPGYWRDEELTDRRFKAGGKYGRIYFTGDFGKIAKSGDLLHLGRKDNQVKVRGYRINLDEIEEALRSIEGIGSAAVLVQNDRQGKSRIVAYLQRDDSKEWTISELRNHLETLLPIYMIPSLIFYIDQLPVAPNGKLNRNLLAGFNCSRPELNNPLALPETDTERFLCSALSEILGVEPIGSKDNLLELGADSIAIFQLIGRIQRILKIDIHPAFVLSAPVIAELACRLEGKVRENVR